MSNICGINHVTILVKNKQKSEEFYINILGLEKIQKGDHLWVKIGNQFIHLSQNSGEPLVNTFYHFAIEVENLLDYLQKLILKEVQIFDFDSNLQPQEINKNLKKPHRLFFTKDPDGNLIEFIDKQNDFYHI
ncbi:hypothetical protein CO172_03060 [Candidatus Uhrbacteria bacterium CG_4_9_14_3_um_filter_36_7]|uniref:VOC domain-containing protein n=1 Tax=Candidatus Uhrbacteria bacterium CG_4_9_14_3_um_filter_36_7 TaxID=1975033 RepID=A0A2M7XGW1_9BACT|nr:MAG: hypothetical protein CO172_03060 [Candidatus Uhrbacteria bacterium CG_4_9_14_3_um_filter_36_7]